MAPDSADPVVRVAGAGDLGALASLRARWSGGARADPAFERRMAEWLAADGDRRTTWLAMLGEAPAGMASILEYRRMPRPGQPDGRWGYVGTVFVREDVRGRGIGTALLHAVTTAADERRYARLVLSPTRGPWRSTSGPASSSPTTPRANTACSSARAGRDERRARTGPSTGVAHRHAERSTANVSVRPSRARQQSRRAA